MYDYETNTYVEFPDYSSSILYNFLIFIFQVGFLFFYTLKYILDYWRENKSEYRSERGITQRNRGNDKGGQPGKREEKERKRL